MNNILIIGLGNIGRHHFRGVLNSNVEANIYLFDLNKNVLTEIINIFTNIKKTKSKYFFVENFESLPKNFKFAIISTNSKERYQILEYLISQLAIEHIILEKFVFSSPIEFQSALNLINGYKTKVYINCPLRLWKSFKTIKQNVINSSRLDIIVSGVGWGLLSNGIHYIDLFSFLTDSTEFYIKDDFIINKIAKSKREGYSELFGTIGVYSKNGNKSLILTCFEGERSHLFININSDNYYYDIFFGADFKIKKKEKTTLYDEMISDEIEFQSSLTASITEQIFRDNTCNLPLFSKTYMFHLCYISVIISYLKKIDIDYSKFYIT